MKHALLLLSTLFLAPSAALFAPLATLHAADTKPSKPNHVDIFIGHMGYADIGPFGTTQVRTPI